jgi:hypothetical protein
VAMKAKIAQMEAELNAMKIAANGIGACPKGFENFVFNLLTSLNSVLQSSNRFAAAEPADIRTQQARIDAAPVVASPSPVQLFAKAVSEKDYAAAAAPLEQLVNGVKDKRDREFCMVLNPAPFLARLKVFVCLVDFREQGYMLFALP